MRRFNTAGPCVPDQHYMLSALERNREVQNMIAGNQYFVIHAARQTGKTTLLKALTREINQQGERYALYCSLESAEIFTEPEKGIPGIISVLQSVIKYSNLPGKEYFAEGVSAYYPTLLTDVLRDFYVKLDKPLVIFFDEIDSLRDGTLISFLRQLRDGYINRQEIPFPASIALVGMRNIRDYRSKIREGRETLGSASPFNIIAKSLKLHDFSRNEIHSLYNQHTAETGQEFEEAAIERAYYYTEGQPWLVNALARECVADILQEDFTVPITPAMIEEAKERIIARRDTHIDSLLERLREDRVRSVVEPMILGQEQDFDILKDPVQYCFDLGLIKDAGGELAPANPIYSEVIIRTLTYNAQFNLIKKVKNVWELQDGSLDMQGLLEGFQQFWRENSEIWVERFQYREAAPHLILQAFLQRLINSGGEIHREYATNRGRVDLNVVYGKGSYPLELKIYYSSKTIPAGMQQLADYLDTLGASEGWLIVFDRDPEKSWEEKIYTQTRRHQDKTIHIMGV